MTHKSPGKNTRQSKQTIKQASSNKGEVSYIREVSYHTDEVFQNLVLTNYSQYYSLYPPELVGKALHA